MKNSVKICNDGGPQQEIKSSFLGSDEDKNEDVVAIVIQALPG